MMNRENIGTIGYYMIGLWIAMFCLVGLIPAIALPGWFLFGFGLVGAAFWLAGK